MNFQGRQQALRRELQKAKLDALLVNHLPNIRYLCGFTGSAGFLIASDGDTIFFTDYRYDQQARAEVKGAKVVIARDSVLGALGKWISGQRRRTSGWRIGVEPEHLTVAQRKRLVGVLPSGLRIRSAPPLVESARMVKDAEELQLIRSAVDLGASLFEHALKVIKPGVRETEVAGKMEYAARQAGAEGMSFPTIIASGERSALPHGRASDQPIPSNAFVVCDFGVILTGYCSDRTRTVWVGPASEDARSVYAAVLEAQAAAISTVRPGISTGEVDAAARRLLKRNKLGRYFTHSTGHGVGLEIHEPPRVAAGQNELLKPGMVITVEPGVYFAGKWGVRIEDVVVVTDTGCEVLTPSGKNFLAV